MAVIQEFPLELIGNSLLSSPFKKGSRGKKIEKSCKIGFFQVFSSVRPFVPGGPAGRGVMWASARFQQL